MGLNPDADPTNMGLNPDADPTNMGLNPHLTIVGINLALYIMCTFMNSTISVFRPSMLSTERGCWKPEQIMADLELLIQTLRSEYRSLDVTIFIFIVYKSWAGGWSDKIIVRFIACGYR